MRRHLDGAAGERRGWPRRLEDAAIVAEASRRCAECGAPLAGDQRYCLECGARAGGRSLPLQELLRRAGRRPRRLAGAIDAPAARAQARPAAPAGAGAGLRLPSARVCALLVAAFIGFGVLLGHVASSPVNDTLASARAPLKLVVPPAPAAVSPSASSGAEEATEAEAAEPELPQAQAESTPAGAAAAPSAGKHTGAGGSEGGSSAGSQPSRPPSSGSSPSGAASEPAKQLPPLKHVFVVMLSDEPYASVFGPSSAAPYLSNTLERRGELLARFDAVGHEELVDEAALISGQGPTTETAADCPDYTEIAQTGSGADSQVLGNGCVYPRSTQTLAGQLAARHLSWRAYVQGIDEAGAQQPACAHPARGASDPTAEQSASTGPYATFRNPFVYFDSIVQTPECAADDVGLAALETDLSSPKTTPNFAYVAPDRCDDGNPTPCTAGARAGVAAAEPFLRQVVGEITASKAFKQDGLLVITTDEAPSSGAFADSSSCCGQPLFPNDPATTITGAPRGGGLVGALLLSPYVKGGSTGQEAANDFSLLATIEDLFGLERLGYAGAAGVKPLEPELFTAGRAAQAPASSR